MHARKSARGCIDTRIGDVVVELLVPALPYWHVVLAACMCIRVRTCGRQRYKAGVRMFVCVCVCVRVCDCVKCECVCVSKRERACARTLQRAFLFMWVYRNQNVTVSSYRG